MRGRGLLRGLCQDLFSLPGLLGLLLVVIVLAAIAAPWIAPFDPAQQNLLGRLKPPGTELRGAVHWLGTDELGRDLLSRILHGARISLLVAFAAVLLSLLVGGVLGMAAGLWRGWLEVLVMRLADVVLSLPAILLAILTVAVLGPSLANLIGVLAFTRWPRYARVAYAQTLSVAHTPYLRAARYVGAGPVRLIWRHITPNALAPLVVVATLEFGIMILFEASLSFLGLGVQPPTPSWGSILAVGRNYMESAWWIATLPGLALFSVVFAVNVWGDHLRDRLDPRALSR
ncbi:MAG: ABC transporter permease [Candidatus Competibacterales bacterium]